MPPRTEIPDSDSTSILRVSSLLLPLPPTTIQPKSEASARAKLQYNTSTVVPTSDPPRHILLSPPTYLSLSVARDTR